LQSRTDFGKCEFIQTEHLVTNNNDVGDDNVILYMLKLLILEDITELQNITAF